MQSGCSWEWYFSTSKHNKMIVIHKHLVLKLHILSLSNRSSEDFLLRYQVTCSEIFDSHWFFCAWRVAPIISKMYNVHCTYNTKIRYSANNDKNKLEK